MRDYDDLLKLSPRDDYDKDNIKLVEKKNNNNNKKTSNTQKRVEFFFKS
jgi:hypothetical protein